MLRYMPRNRRMDRKGCRLRAHIPGIQPDNHAQRQTDRQTVRRMDTEDSLLHARHTRHSALQTCSETGRRCDMLCTDIYERPIIRLSVVHSITTSWKKISVFFSSPPIPTRCLYWFQTDLNSASKETWNDRPPPHTHTQKNVLEGDPPWGD